METEVLVQQACRLCWGWWMCVADLLCAFRINWLVLCVYFFEYLFIYVLFALRVITVRVRKQVFSRHFCTCGSRQRFWSQTLLLCIGV
jgi:hypothetical protein